MNTRRAFLQAGTLFFAPAFLPGGPRQGLRISESIRFQDLCGLAGTQPKGFPSAGRRTTKNS